MNIVLPRANCIDQCRREPMAKHKLQEKPIAKRKLDSHADSCNTRIDLEPEKTVEALFFGGGLRQGELPA